MIVNFKKLKSQIKPFLPEAGGRGYIFIATDEQKEKDLYSMSLKGSKRKLISFLVENLRDDQPFKDEFAL